MKELLKRIKEISVIDYNGRMDHEEWDGSLTLSGIKRLIYGIWHDGRNEYGDSMKIQMCHHAHVMYEALIEEYKDKLEPFMMGISSTIPDDIRLKIYRKVYSIIIGEDHMFTLCLNISEVAIAIGASRDHLTDMYVYPHNYPELFKYKKPGNGGYWWPKSDKQSRVIALDKAINTLSNKLNM